MAGADVGCSDQDPLDVVAELVQVAHHLVEAEGQVAADILEQHEGGAQNGQRVGHIGPEVALVLLAQASASLAERLARVSARDDVYARDGRPVDLGNVSQVGRVRVAVGEHLARALVDVGHPYGAGVEHFLGGTVEHSSAREQAADGELSRVHPCGCATAHGLMNPAACGAHRVTGSLVCQRR